MGIKYQDRIGQKFNKLLILDFVRKDTRKYFYFCRCDCGKEKLIKCDHVILGSQKSCGCERYENRFKNLTGEKFGRLTVIGLYEKKANRIFWKCKCDCGNISIVESNNLKHGHTQSCGCYRIQRIKETKIIHGQTKTRLYRIFSGMKSRCYNSKNSRFNRYGARGIEICEEWNNKETGFMNFSKWALENGYADNLSIDRLDNNKGYSPNNCRWASGEQQAQNRSTNKYIMYEDKKICIARLSRILNIPATTLQRKLEGENK